jgi:DhnA family fructose-bisphosphate aldolase class Ia
MPDLDDVQDGKNYHIGVPMQSNTFFLKGSNSLDWGMKNRLARVFNPATGRTVMLAVDHGYFQGPTTGLERIDISIVPLVPYADALMITRDAGNRQGIPTLAVTGVGKELARDAKYLGLATRICAEMGAHFVKTYFCEKGFARVAAACPVPLVIAGGKKLPELEALQMAYEAIDQGAAGVDMGRNIFQCDAPIAMIQAVRAVVHDQEKPDKAYELYLSLKKDAARTGPSAAVPNRSRS